jgi:PAS domain S-box-containing protein
MKNFSPPLHTTWERLINVFLIGVFIAYVISFTRKRDRLALGLQGSVLKAEGEELIKDISRSVQAEELLIKSELRYRNLVENTSDWVWEVDENGVYTYASSRIRSLLGYEPEEMIDKTPFDFMPQVEAQRVEVEFASIVAERRPFSLLENANRHKDGRLVVLETSGVPVFEADGTFRGYRGIDRDVTERKLAEREILRLNENLAERAAELAIVNRELEAFSSSVSHDLRAPLTRIFSAGQILRDIYSQDLSEEGKMLVDTICCGCESMEQLIKALLALSHVASSDMSRVECDLSKIARRIVTELHLENPGRAVVFIIAPDLTDMVDPSLCKVLLENLLGNAWKYTQKTRKARIEFGTTSSGGERVYFVRDNGVGFAMNNATKLFEPFLRLHDDSDFKGFGIGLATAKRIIERHGGRIWGEGEVGRGATIYFTLFK